MRRQQQETAAELPQPVISTDPDPVALGEYTLSASVATLRNPGGGFTGYFTDGFSYLNLLFDNSDSLDTQSLRAVVVCDDPTFVIESEVYGADAFVHTNRVCLRISRGDWITELTVQVYERG